MDLACGQGCSLLLESLWPSCMSSFANLVDILAVSAVPGLRCGKACDLSIGEARPHNASCDVHFNINMYAWQQAADCQTVRAAAAPPQPEPMAASGEHGSNSAWTHYRRSDADDSRHRSWSQDQCTAAGSHHESRCYTFNAAQSAPPSVAPSVDGVTLLACSGCAEADPSGSPYHRKRP